MKKIFIFFAICIALHHEADAQNRQLWSIEQGSSKIVFDASDTSKLPHKDNIELSGRMVAGIITYSVDTNGTLKLNREIFFPQLHEYKPTNQTAFFNYRAYLQESFDDSILPKLYTNNEQFVVGRLEQIAIDGTLNFIHSPSIEGVAVKRKLYPSMHERLFEEQWTVINRGDKELSFTSGNRESTYEDYGAEGLFTRKITSDVPASFTLRQNDSITFSVKIMAKKQDEEFPSKSTQETLSQREEFLEEMASSLILETPSQEINTLFEFSKIRGSESIYDSKLGLIHSPGGGRYYVGIWANDQAEYISPLFPYLGYETGVESALNCYRAFAKEINHEYTPIRYSFEVEGLPPFIKDRGDAAMIAYGASHFAMASGDKEVAEELWELIEWTLEYCHRQLNEEGVVTSQSDEMEGRIETGSANLSTSSLYYGALHHSIYLAKALDKDKKVIKSYQTNLQNLGKAIENYFGDTVEGLDTYKYYKEHTALRHWICLPLVVGIFDRKDATLEALFERLWTDNGVHVERNNPKPGVSDIFWDRGTLYALRGAFFSGETERSLERLEEFTSQRLLGERVPYVVEAAPEGAMAHLSAESGLYCRIFTEGIFGIEPTGLNSFMIKPHMPKSWEHMALRSIKAYGSDFDIEITRANDKLKVVISEDGEVRLTKIIKEGSSIEHHLK